MIGTLLDRDDVETTRNCSRALATFSSKAYYLSLMSEVEIYPRIVELYENTDNDVSVRRSALATLANFTSDINYCKKLFTESRILNITKAICHPYTEDMLISNAVSALANLACSPEFADLILTNYFSTIDIILQYTQGTDSQASWEVDICYHLLSDSVDKKIFQANYSQGLQRDDKFNYEGVRLLVNLLTKSTKTFFFFIILQSFSLLILKK